MTQYPIKLIPQGLSSEETVLEIASSLEYLNAVANDIFQRISKRIESEQETLEDISSEVSGIESKVEELINKKSGYKLTSSSQYPGRNESPYSSLLAAAKEEPHPSYRRVQAKEDGSLKTYAKEVFSFSPPRKKGSEKTPKHHLPSLKSAPSSLLFNTNERAYLKQSGDPFNDPLRISKKLTHKVSPKKIDDKSSVEVSEELGETSSQGEEAPDLDLPDDLDLDNIAISFNDEVCENRQEKEVVEEDESIPPVPLNIPMPPSVNIPPPPPLPPVNIPIPPPPPMAPKAPEVKVDLPKKQEKTPKDVASDDYDRNDLLSAIRKAGGSQGAGLRSAKDRKLKSPTPTTAKVSNEGDLMQMLANNLRLRRKGMSGQWNPEESGGGSDSNKVLQLPRVSDEGETNESDDTDSDW